VVTQVALAVVLLAGAGLTLKSFWRAEQAPLGFDPHGVLTMSLALPEGRYDKDEKVNAFVTRLLERVRNLPGVEQVAVAYNIPFDENESDSYFHLTGTPPIEPGHEVSAEIAMVSSDYFRVMGMPIIRGRGFNAEDTAGKPRSVIIDESFARRYFPGEDPIGRHIDDNQTREDNPPPLTVIGVVPRTRNEAPGEENVEKLNFSHMYFATDQLAQSDMKLLVRASSGDPLALAPAIKREVQALDADQPVGQVATMEENIASSLAARRLTMTLLGAFAGLALVLASVGLYGVMALSVTQRTRELGIRLALGAARADVFRLVLGQAVALVSLGLGLGLLGALAAGRALASLLYNVGAIDAAALGTALLSLGPVALLACFFPARRATRVDPMVALREE
jgi:putative ABC transport system permease protein